MFKISMCNTSPCFLFYKTKATKTVNTEEFDTDLQLQFDSTQRHERPKTPR